MRYLVQQTLNRRAPYDQRFYVDMTSSVVMNTSNNVLVPKGSTSQRPVAPTEGMIRYNTTTHELEAYQGSSAAWRAIRFKEATQITQQSLGAGDNTTVYFGPLSSAYNASSAGSISAYSSPSSSDISSYGGQNIIVLVENVMQISGTNYTVVQNPTVGSETYNAYTNAIAGATSTILYFNGSINASSATASGTTITVTFPAQPNITPFAAGSSIVVTGFTPTAYNGTYTVTSSTATTVVYTAGSAPGISASVIGNVTSTNAIFPAVNITGATVTGSSYLQSSTLVSSYTTDPYTGALTSITLSKATVTGSIPANTNITITENSRTISDGSYWLFFSSPPPYGKTVTALFGFDQ
jgi:hypothetical protein